MAEDAETPTPEIPSPETTTPANDPPSIQLDHFLQSCGVPTGGQAKRLIQSGEVLVNNEVETRRKKKLRIGDTVSVDGDEYEVVLDDGSDAAEAAEE